MGGVSRSLTEEALKKFATRGAACTILGSVSTERNNPAETAALLADIRLEHRDLDDAIRRLAADATVDQLGLTRMKKRKLKLKDWIAYLESRLIPDLDA